jgi:hypothetical protein
LNDAAPSNENEKNKTSDQVLRKGMAAPDYPPSSRLFVQNKTSR